MEENVVSHFEVTADAHLPSHLPFYSLSHPCLGWAIKDQGIPGWVGCRRTVQVGEPPPVLPS